MHSVHIKFDLLWMHIDSTSHWVCESAFSLKTLPWVSVYNIYVPLACIHPIMSTVISQGCCWPSNTNWKVIAYLGWAWVIPTMVMTTAPMHGIIVSEYLQYVSFTSCLSHLGSQDSCAPWDALCISVYWHAHVRDLQLPALDWTTRTTGATHCLLFRLSMKTGRWMRRHVV